MTVWETNLFEVTAEVMSRLYTVNDCWHWENDIAYATDSIFFHSVKLLRRWCDRMEILAPVNNDYLRSSLTGRVPKLQWTTVNWSIYSQNKSGYNEFNMSICRLKKNNAWEIVCWIEMIIYLKLLQRHKFMFLGRGYPAASLDLSEKLVFTQLCKSHSFDCLSREWSCQQNEMLKESSAVTLYSTTFVEV